MTRVVVVHHDPAVGAEQAALLRSAGYDAEACGGPLVEHCPVLEAHPCPLADRADVLVYDAWAAGSGESGHELIAQVRDLYADLPLVLTGVDEDLAWVETEGPERVTPLRGRPDLQRLTAAIESALADQGMAV